jgi:hypothetical protein
VTADADSVAALVPEYTNSPRTAAIDILSPKS